MKRLMPDWPPKDWRSFIALIASVGGGAVAFVLAWRSMTLVSSGRWYLKGLSPEQLFELAKAQLQSMDMMAKGALILMGISIIGLWFVLGRRSIVVQGPGGTRLEAGGGEDDDPDPPELKTVTTTETTLKT